MLSCKKGILLLFADCIQAFLNSDFTSFHVFQALGFYAKTHSLVLNSGFWCHCHLGWGDGAVDCPIIDTLPLSIDTRYMALVSFLNIQELATTVR